MNIEKKWIVSGLILIITGIILGAFGAHALKVVIFDPEKLIAYETGVRYQIYNGILFMIVPFLINSLKIKSNWLFGLLISGVCLFSVSIYLLTIRELIGLESLKSFLGPLTPFGGLLMIIGWSILTFRVAKTKNSFIF